MRSALLERKGMRGRRITSYAAS